ncbi:hypothetical protein Tco_0534188 [Tanacetum coccineum]
MEGENNKRMNDSEVMDFEVVTSPANMRQRGTIPETSKKMFINTNDTIGTRRSIQKSETTLRSNENNEDTSQSNVGYRWGRVLTGVIWQKIHHKTQQTWPRMAKNNMYSFDMKNIVPKETLTYLVAKAASDESMLWEATPSFLIEPTSIAKALSDSSCVEAMQEEPLQFKLQ